MFVFKGRSRAEQQHAIDETRTMAIQQLLMIEWRGQGESESDSDLRLSLTEMLEEADACGRLLQKGLLLSPEEFDGLRKIRDFLSRRRANTLRAVTLPSLPKPRPGIPRCRLVRSR